MSLIEQYSDVIQKLCYEHKVKRLYVFGSVLTDKFNSDSDIDFLVDFQPQDAKQYTDNYFNFKFSLQESLNRSIDLVEEKTIRNPYFKQAIENQRQLIYGH